LNSLSETISERDDSDTTQFALLRIKYHANLNVNQWKDALDALAKIENFQPKE